MIKIFKLIQDVLTQELNLLIETGRTIEDIANQYPSDGVDAAIIFEEWCKGVLSTKRPPTTMLRDYAKFTASDECWNNYINKARKVK